MTALRNGSKGILIGLSHPGGRSGYRRGGRREAGLLSDQLGANEQDSLRPSSQCLGLRVRVLGLPWDPHCMEMLPSYGHPTSLPCPSIETPKETVCLIITFPMMLPTSCRKKHRELTSYSRKRKALVTDTVMSEEREFKWSREGLQALFPEGPSVPI